MLAGEALHEFAKEDLPRGAPRPAPPRAVATWPSPEKGPAPERDARRFSRCLIYFTLEFGRA